MVRVVNIYYSNTRHFGYDMKRIYDSNMKYLLPCAFNTCSMILFSLAIENLYVNFCLKKCYKYQFSYFEFVFMFNKMFTTSAFYFGGREREKKGFDFLLDLNINTHVCL